jgi:hypothetical protein
MSFNNTRRNDGGVRAGAKTGPFCKVCYDAKCSVAEYTSHFVKDQPGPNGRVVCPTLLAQKCLICGVPGHTSSYCPDNSSVSSSSSSLSTIQKEPPRYALATDEIRYNSIRLPPIQKQPQQQQQQQQYSRPAPRIVYANELPSKPTTTTTTIDVRREFPSLPNLSSLRRFENGEPKLKRELPAEAEASPVHSPIAQQSPKKWKKVKYNKKNNPFGALVDNNVDSDVDSDVDSGDEKPIMPAIQKQKQEKTSSSSSSSSSSWASIAAASSSKSIVVEKSKQPQQRARSRFSIVVATAISAAPPLLPPISFKPKPVSASDSALEKKLWGDTDSEDDEEFLKRGPTFLTEQQ